MSLKSCQRAPFVFTSLLKIFHLIIVEFHCSARCEAFGLQERDSNTDLVDVHIDHVSPGIPRPYCSAGSIRHNMLQRGLGVS